MAKVGRNEPCPCGSGQKYKKCCLGTPRDPAARPPPGPHGALRWLLPLTVPTDIKRSLRDIEGLLRARGVTRLPDGKERDAQADFEEACFERWSALAPDTGPLAEASEAAFQLMPEDTPTKPLPAVVRVLADAGEDGVPHLAALLHTDDPASEYGIAALVAMPAGPLCDRAVVEALFVRGDVLQEPAVRHVRAWEDGQVWAAFEGVARRAAEDGLELQGISWTALFRPEQRDDDRPVPPRGRLGDALRLLYDLGHFGALAFGLRFLLDPDLDEAASVRLFLADVGVQDALAHIRGSAPPPRLARDEAPMEMWGR